MCSSCSGRGKRFEEMDRGGLLSTSFHNYGDVWVQFPLPSGEGEGEGMK